MGKIKYFIVTIIIVSSIQGGQVEQRTEEVIQTPQGDTRVEFVQDRGNIVLAEITAYSEHDTGNTVMASGKEVYYGALAHDKLPIGTVVEIDGETFVVEDRLSEDLSYPQHRFDMYLPSRGSCIEFGRQWRKIKILEE